PAVRASASVGTSGPGWAKMVRAAARIWSRLRRASARRDAWGSAVMALRLSVRPADSRTSATAERHTERSPFCEWTKTFRFGTLAIDPECNHPNTTGTAQRDPDQPTIAW